MKSKAYPAAPADVSDTDPPSQKVVIAPEDIDGLELVTTGMYFMVARTGVRLSEVHPLATAST